MRSLLWFGLGFRLVSSRAAYSQKLQKTTGDKVSFGPAHRNLPSLEIDLSQCKFSAIRGQQIEQISELV